MFVNGWRQEDQEYKATFAAEHVRGQSGFHETLSQKTKQTKFEIFRMLPQFQAFYQPKGMIWERGYSRWDTPITYTRVPTGLKRQGTQLQEWCGLYRGGNRKRLVRPQNTRTQICDRKEGTLQWMFSRTIGRGTFHLSRASAREKTDLHGEHLRCMIWCDAKM